MDSNLPIETKKESFYDKIIKFFKKIYKINLRGVGLMIKDVPPLILSELMDNGYENLIVDIILYCEDTNKIDCEISDIPIPTRIMENSNEHVIISKKVFEVYRRLVQRISNPETAKEIPFFLLGNSKVVNGKKIIEYEDIIYNIEEAISETRVSADDSKFNELLKDDRYNVISIGHTHGNVKEAIKKRLLASNLSQELRNKYGIRSVGLNLSIADIWQHEYYKQIANNITQGKQIFQTIIMYNGDFITISFEKISISRDVTVNDRNRTMIPTGEEPSKSWQSER